MLKPQVFANHEAVSRHAADWIVNQLRKEPSALLCLACGTTPMRTYQLLAEQGAREPELFAKCRVIKLDEWGGLPPGDTATCEAQLRSTLIEPLRLHEQYVSFNGQSEDPKAECARISSWLLHHGPIDTCVLGLGVNGHIGFNEPDTFLEPHAHVAPLSQASLEHAMLRQTTHRPTYGLTLGMADLLQSRHVLLLVTGSTKREPLRRLLTGAITTDFPGSLLQLHQNTVVLYDAAANPTEQ
ncbi:MAG TPA: 6-phosphogluconolactonase [Lacipirellulaceae bacterium]|jgi:galactosamine-6-phosphate isomerase|nr:6-phosphogluconolactonase [Lacipirellulaceae bacterium]